MGKFLSQNAGLKELYNYNKFVKSLPKATADKNIAEEILAYSKVYNPSDKLEQYVPNSEKYNSILKQKTKYEFAQNKLKEYNHSKELILDEHYNNYITVYRHNLSYITEDYDYDTCECYEITKECFFYTEGSYDAKILNKIDDLLLTYDHKTSKWSDDENSNPLGNFIHYADRIAYELKVYKMCLKTHWDVETFFRIFDQENTVFTEYGEVRVNGELYYRNQVEKLMEDYKIAKDKKYIYEDRYVEYPKYKSYMQFLELLKESIYKEIPE
jgi:hypothetical protein